jgi:hypothetical protein
MSLPLMLGSNLENKNYIFIFMFLIFTLIFAIVVFLYLLNLRPHRKGDLTPTCYTNVVDDSHDHVVIQQNCYNIKYHDPFGLSLEKHNVHHAMLSRANVYDFFKIM